MANFNTHIAVGSMASGLAATVALAAGLAQPTELLTLTGAGVIGSLLPDIDLDKSGPSRFLFGALGVILAFGALLRVPFDQLSLIELWLGWLVIYGTVRYGAWHVFMNYTAHRGVWHSLLAGVFFMVLTAVLLASLAGEEPAIAWLGGVFVLFGYGVHLTLDEIYAVDFENAHLKKSFGTALKLFEYRSLASSALMAAAVAGAVFVAPAARPFADKLAAVKLRSFLVEKTLPKGQWLHLARDGASRTAGDSTGSISTRP